MYSEVAEASQRPFYGIQARGWRTQRSPLHGIQAMAAYYIQIIQYVLPEGPYDLGGYSLGGHLAYEVTRQLQEQGHAVNTIVMIDSLYSDSFSEIPEPSYKTYVLQAANFLLMQWVIMFDPKKYLKR